MKTASGEIVHHRYELQSSKAENLFCGFFLSHYTIECSAVDSRTGESVSAPPWLPLALETAGFQPSTMRCGEIEESCYQFLALRWWWRMMLNMWISQSHLAAKTERLREVRIRNTRRLFQDRKCRHEVNSFGRQRTGNDTLESVIAEESPKKLDHLMPALTLVKQTQDLLREPDMTPELWLGSGGGVWGAPASWPRQYSVSTSSSHVIGWIGLGSLVSSPGLPRNLFEQTLSPGHGASFTGISGLVLE